MGADSPAARIVRDIVESHWILARDGQPDHRIPVPLR